MKRFILAITGASGVVYAQRLFDYLQPRAELHVVISERGAELLRIELQTDPGYFARGNATLYPNARINAAIASGSFPADAMIVIPASMGTIGRIANGVSGSLIERAADAVLKERRKLILVPRETPFNSIHLRNLTLLDQAGALILPAAPGFYNQPRTISDLVDFVIARILKHLDVEQSFLPPYQSGPTAES